MGCCFCRSLIWRLLFLRRRLLFLRGLTTSEMPAQMARPVTGICPLAWDWLRPGLLTTVRRTALQFRVQLIGQFKCSQEL